jgi:hypothetical protein
LIALENTCKGIWIEIAQQVGQFNVLTSQAQAGADGKRKRNYIEAILEFK